MSVRTLPRPEDLDREPAGGDRQPARARSAASSKWMASALSIVLMSAVLAPVLQNWKDAPRDDFPFSYYPMFTADKADRQRVTYLIVYDADRNRFLLPYWYAGQGGLNQVRRQMNKLVDRGQASRLCRMVASRVARSAELSSDMSAVEIVTGTFLMTEFFAGKRVPVSESVRAQCAVQRG